MCVYVWGVWVIPCSVSVCVVSVWLWVIPVCFCVSLVVGLDHPYVSVSGYSVGLGYFCVSVCVWVCCLQCFDAVGWAAGKAPGL